MTALAHFAGINTAALAQRAEGQSVLVSFADAATRPGVFGNEVMPRIEAGAYPSVILDSGAFTVISQGITIDVHAYGAFIQENGHLFSYVVNLDDIAGDLGQSWINQQVLETYAPEGVEIMPVFHEGEPWAVLEMYCERSNVVGLGFARKEGGRLANPEASRLEWLDTALDHIGDRAEVHGFAMQRLRNRPTNALHSGLTTTDSTTWIAEACALKRSNEAPGASHGVTQVLAMVLANLCPWALTLASYGPPTTVLPAAAVALVEDHSIGQARTVLRRLVALREAATVPGAGV